MPANLDGDFLLVQEDKIKEVESKLKGTYYTDMMVLRNYQEPSKIFFSAPVFKDLFPGRKPEFVGHAQNPTPAPTPAAAAPAPTKPAATTSAATSPGATTPAATTPAKTS
jgi:hypothetical protein